MIEIPRQVSSLIGELDLLREEAIQSESGDDYEDESLRIMNEEVS